MQVKRPGFSPTYWNVLRSTHICAAASYHYMQCRRWPWFPQTNWYSGMLRILPIEMQVQRSLRIARRKPDSIKPDLGKMNQILGARFRVAGRETKQIANFVRVWVLRFAQHEGKRRGRHTWFVGKGSPPTALICSVPALKKEIKHGILRSYRAYE